MKPEPNLTDLESFEYNLVSLQSFEPNLSTQTEPFGLFHTSFDHP